MQSVLTYLFAADVFVLMLLLFGATWSVAFPARRIWPPPGRESWQYRLTWAAFYFVFAASFAIFLLDWNGWAFKNPLRLLVGVPLALLGGMLVSWGIATLGARNTSGLRDGFVRAGPYRFTRNPQYLGDMMLFLGLGLIANSLYLWIAHLLLILVFLITPLAEEPWLEAQYGDSYLSYKRETSRFL